MNIKLRFTKASLKTLRYFIILQIIALLHGCITVGPDYTPPELQVPDAWHQTIMEGFKEGQSSLQTWWKTFKDPLLNSLIDRAQSGNLDLKKAIARIREGRARLGIATGGKYPEINNIGDFIKHRTSERFRVPTTQQKRNQWFLRYGLDATWELDFWGRIRRNVESADANLTATIEDFRDVLVLLYSEVAKNYTNVRTLQARLRYAKNNVSIQRDTLELTKNRLDAGIVSELDMRQAELNLANTESVIPTLESMLIQTIHRLGVLLGKYPNALYNELIQPAAIPKPPEEVIVGLPIELLRQRPDIRRAERELASQTAKIGVVKADLFPRFSLTGEFVFASTAMGNLFDWSSRMWAWGPTIRWNLFDGGRIRSNIKAEEALTEQALARYESTVLKAFEDVQNAMVDYIRESEREAVLNRSVEAAEKSAQLVEKQYILGITDFQNVLDMQRSLFQTQDNLAVSEGNVTLNLIRIYTALGGGWAPEYKQPAAVKTVQKAATTASQVK